MSKFIKLTCKYGNEIHVNIEKIVSVYEHLPQTEKLAALVTTGSGEDDYFQIDLESYKRLVRALYE